MTMLVSQAPFDQALGSAEPLRVESHTLDALPDEWREPWDQLAGLASEPNVFAERWFVEASLALEPPAGARLLSVWSGPLLIGLLPVAPAYRYGRTPVAHVQNWLHHHAFLGTPLVRAGRERSFWSAIIETLDGARWARGFFHMVGLVENGPVHRGLVASAAEASRPCVSVHRRERAFLESHLSPAEYYQQAVRKGV